MGRLFLIGNGYDMNRRKGDTSYLSFKKWLMANYLKGDKGDFITIDNPEMISRATKVSSYSGDFLKNFGISNETSNKVDQERKEYAARLLCSMFNEDQQWCKFENSLGDYKRIKNYFKNFMKKVPESSDLLKSKPGSPVPWGWDMLTSFADCIHALFTEWVNSLPSTKDIGVEKGPFENEYIKKISPDDVFIIFNYTTTIEDLFNCYADDIFFHIHGKVNENIIVGHNNKGIRSTILSTKEDYVKEFLCGTRKPISSIIKKNNQLWNKIKELSAKNEKLDIYEFGWSCQETDYDYINKICRIVKKHNGNVTLWLNDYQSGGAKKAEQWKKCRYGFDGDIYLYEEKEKKIDSWSYSETGI